MDLILGRGRSAWAYGLIGVGGLLFVGLSLGCMSFTIGGKTQVVSPAAEDAAAGVQRGTTFVPPGQVVSIYYPMPYTSPPNLEFEDADGKRHVQVVEQKGDFVQVKNMSSTGIELSWKTRGVMPGTAKAQAAQTVIQAATPPTLELRPK